jgi:predicted CoA-substrate-specific enzyme activase
MKRLGIDVGSLNLNAVILQDGEILERASFEHAGRIESAVRTLLDRPGFSSFDTAGATGSLAGAGRGIIDNTLATIEGAMRLLPGCRNVIAMGGQSFSLILLDGEGRYVEHAANPPCASGTGSFLEQQAERLGVSVKELALRAVQFSGKVPRIASRCAVFAKTDIVHAMQEGHSLDAVSAGLCEGIARSMLDMLLKGRTLSAPVGLVGGVALNAKIASAIECLLGAAVVVPSDCQCAGAIGAALLGAEKSIRIEALLTPSTARRQVRTPLARLLADYPSFGSFEMEERDEVEIFRPRGESLPKTGYYLGIDIGSTSTKAALTGPDGRFAAGFYARTGGDPIGAVQRLLRVIGSTESAFGGALPGGAPRLLGAATTGSGRAMIHQVFQADRVVNEITAHAKAAVFLHPGVDTIIEIGGQDSKFTRIRDGEVYFSAMNYVCAAGTGSFIEEQARRLGASLAEFSEMAMSESAPFTSDRCTVYMERDLAALLGEGWSREALAGAVLHSVRDNYLSKVVGKSPLGDTIVFQGATARNRALVSAFEEHLGKTIHVSPYCHLTGALGAALQCRDEGLASSSFIWETEPIVLETEECRLCANHCALTVVERHGVRTGWGMKCGREYADRKASGRAALTDVSAPEQRFRDAMSPLYDTSLTHASAAARQRSSITIGIPRGLYSFSYEPLWRSFLMRLGFSVETSDQRKEALEEGAASVNSDFCAPMILAHGYVKQLLDRGVDYIFSPAVSNEREGSEPDRSSFRRRQTDSAFCYYSQYLPSVVGKLTAFETGGRLISPLLPLREKSDEEIADLIHEELSARIPGLEQEETRDAFRHAAALFRDARAQLAGTFDRMERRTRGDGSGDDPLRVVLLGRPYVAFDAVLNTSLPRTFEQLGASVYWQEELALEQLPLTYARQYEERMHWHYGRLIVRAAEYAARTENLFPVFLTCFRCSPDSFLMSYVKDILTHFGKPFLFLQLDAHASDVGYLTRIEAALQSFRNHRARERLRAHPAEPVVRARNDELREGDTVLISAVDTLISRFWADAFTRAGNPTLLLDPSASALNTGFRYSSGGECTPLVSIVGAAIEKVRTDCLDPARTFFFFPTTLFSCNMPQFPVFADMAFRAAGINGLRIGWINFMAIGDTLPQILSMKLVEGYIVACTLYKLAARIRPYERIAGETDKALQASEGLVRAAIRSGSELRTPLAQAVEMFRSVPRDESAGRKPRIAILGDLYVKYNAVVNEGIQSLVEELDGELIVSSMTEYPAHLLDIGVRRYGEDPRSYRILRTIEQRYEKLAEDLIGDQPEPDFAECVKLMEEYGISHYIAGETSINVGRALWYCTHGKVEAIVHVNPLFCCPGVVTASLFRRVQKDFGIPIVDIFYDGAANPNRVLIPHLHYLKKRP